MICSNIQYPKILDENFNLYPVFRLFKVIIFKYIFRIILAQINDNKLKYNLRTKFIVSM